ncbi:hypothetical protein NF867_01635 [Solitalea sp. MAHUQ-68]|uniref:Uncharacterized protein n=1 Tax=Solitalea agri TaxID=2953739 RepID=A0A9X2JBL1_9SPHI|nr:hypothetical protein [Solitalea agri]MCO4291564.1 hypothetical protein [Solitalea agri]
MNPGSKPGRGCLGKPPHISYKPADWFPDQEQPSSEPRSVTTKAVLMVWFTVWKCKYVVAQVVIQVVTPITLSSYTID